MVVVVVVVVVVWEVREEWTGLVDRRDGTGAAAGLGTRWFAETDPESLGIVGASLRQEVAPALRSDTDWQLVIDN